MNRMTRAIGQPCSVCPAFGWADREMAEETTIGWRPHTDEQGREHRHDPNRKTVTLLCENGHSWLYSWRDSCGVCGWTRDADRRSLGRVVSVDRKNGIIVIDSEEPKA